MPARSRCSTLLALVVLAAGQAAAMTEVEALRLAKASFDAYPWRMRTTVTTQGTAAPVTGLVEAQSAERVRVLSRQPVGAATVVLDAIVIDRTLFAKATGAPPEQLARYGVTAGQWTQVPASHPMAGFIELALGMARPMSILEKMGLTEKGVGTQPLRLVGPESANGVATSVYETTRGAGPAGVTYRFAVGTKDQRLYKMESISPRQTATTTVEYDRSLRVDSPLR